MIENILIVDDSRLSRTMIRHFIETLSPEYAIHEAPSGVEALLTLETISVNMAIIDINMPGLSGLDLIDALQEKKRNINLVLLSANIQEGIQNRAKEKGIKFFSKPINEITIQNILNHFKNTTHLKTE